MLTSRADIRDIMSKHFPSNNYIDDTTVAYVQNLVAPYARAVQQWQTVESVLDWITSTYGSELGQEGVAYVSRFGNRDLAMIKNVAIEFLISEILEYAKPQEYETWARLILPWDIRRGIDVVPDLQRMFPGREEVLPVTVTIDGKTYQEKFSADFCAGFMAASRAAKSVEQARPKITFHMYGVELRPDFDINYVDGHQGVLKHYNYLYDERRIRMFEMFQRELPDIMVLYQVPVQNDIMLFQTTDYLDGAKFASQRLMFDMHNVITNVSVKF